MLFCAYTVVDLSVLPSWRINVYRLNAPFGGEKSLRREQYRIESKFWSDRRITSDVRIEEIRLPRTGAELSECSSNNSICGQSASLEHLTTVVTHDASSLVLR